MTYTATETSSDIPGATAGTSATKLTESHGLSTYIAIQIKRYLSDWSSLFFSIGLPILFFLVFGASLDRGGDAFPHGNVTAYVMIGMAIYGGVTAAVASAGQTIMEQTTGWGRQLALTPMSTSRIVLSQAILVLFAAVLPIAAMYLLGLVIGAEMEPRAWIVSFILCVVTCLPFGFYGYAWALLLPKPSALSIASGSIVVLSYLGNLFIPMQGTLLAISRFTPLFGSVTLSRYPLTAGLTPSTDTGAGLYTEPLWVPIVNVAVWSILLIGFCIYLNKREKSRL